MPEGKRARRPSRNAATPAVVAIGESLIRLSPPPGETLEGAPTLAVHVGGAEANVCAGLAQLGVPATWISRLPANALGRRIASAVRGYGVNVDGIVWVPEDRAGVMFVQPGAGLRAGGVVYYRRDSAFAGIDPDDVEWDRLSGSAVVHLTGITPALGRGPLAVVERALAEARRRRVAVSFDVNYRSTLWPPPAARRRLEPLLRGLDIVLLNDRDAAALFDQRGDPEEIAARLRGPFRCGALVLTRGHLGAVAIDGTGVHRQPAYPTEIVDRIGRGDAFVAGYLYAWLRGRPSDGVRYGAAMAALKQTYRGDVCLTTIDEVETVIRGEAVPFRR